MPKVIEAVYENGVFKPLEKVKLREKTKAKIIIADDIENMRGKYREVSMNIEQVIDEIHDRRKHIH